MVRHKTRLLNQLKFTLKEYYPRPIEVFGDLESRVAVDCLKQYSTPTALSKLSRKQWSRFAEQHPHLTQARSAKLWEELKKPQLMVPDHVVRAKAQLLEVLLDQLEAEIAAKKDGSSHMPIMEVVKTYPKEVFIAMGMRMAENISYYIFTVISITFVTRISCTSELQSAMSTTRSS